MEGNFEVDSLIKEFPKVNNHLEIEVDTFHHKLLNTESSHYWWPGPPLPAGNM